MKRRVDRNFLRAAILAAGSAFFCLLPASAGAAVNYYLVMPGIDGGSTSVPNAIDVLSFSWGVSQTASAGGSGGGARAGRPVFQDFAWSQLIGKSTPKEFLDLSTGTHIASATFEIMKPLGDKEETFFKIIFGQVLLTSLNFGGQGGSLPIENATFDYRTVTMDYYTQNANGTLGTPLTASYDLVTNQGNLGALALIYALGTSGGPPVSGVPEPDTYALMLAGLAVVGLVARRRRAVRN